jgi:serine protease Do
MTDRPTDFSKLPSFKAPRRSLLSARRFALMASVVAGLGVAGYGLSPQPGRFRSSSRSALPTSSSA